jgi:hypothetical protein
MKEVPIALIVFLLLLLVATLGAICGALVTLVSFSDRRQTAWGGIHGAVAWLCGIGLAAFLGYLFEHGPMSLEWKTVTNVPPSMPEGNIYTGWFALAGAAMGFVFASLQARLSCDHPHVRIMATLLYSIVGAIALGGAPAETWIS